MTDPKTTRLRGIFHLGPKTRSETAFWFGLVAPLAVLIVGLKLWRVVERGEISVWWAAPDLIRSDLLLAAAFAAFGVASFRGLANRLGSRVVLAIQQVIAVLLAGVEVVANHFFSVTGSTFDLHLLWFSVGRFDETFQIITSEVSTGAWLFLGTTIGVLIALPWVIRTFVKQRDKQRDAAPIKDIRFGAAVAIGCLIVAAFPPLADDYTAFGRATVINMALSIPDLRWANELEGHIDRQSLEHIQLSNTEDAGDSPRNVAIIILESTRAQSTTIHNPRLDTTPYLAQLAENSTVAYRAYTPMPHTSKALVATLCGLEPRLRMPITESRTDGLPARCLAELLGDQGYSSVFFQSATERFEDRPQLVENMGYDEFFPLERMDDSDYEEANYFGVEDAIMLPYSRQWLQEHGDRPFLSTYLTLTPHHDYQAPRRRYGRFDFAEDDELNRYKNTLYYVDQFTRELMDQYRQRGVYEDTLFVVIGDHGEAFGEHGRTQHDNVIWEPGLHVPFLIYDPQNPDRQPIHAPVSQLDAVPTILARLGYDTDAHPYPGMPIEQSDEDRVVYAHCWYERRCMARIAQRFKYIDHFAQRAPEVYDLIEDPGEQQDLSDQMQDEVRRWRAEVYDWRRAVNAVYQRAHSDYVDDHLYDTLPDGVTEQSFQLGDFARYLGYEIDTETLRRGRRVSVTHYFQVLDDIGPGWKLFIHGQSGDEMLNLDRVPVDGMHSLQEWEPGTIVADEHSFRIPHDWSSGEFSLFVGIYHDDYGRVPVDGPSDGNRRGVVFQKEFH